MDSMNFDAIIDGRMLKRYEENPLFGKIPLIGLGPGFVAGGNCDAVIETNRGPGLGQAIFTGSAEENTGIPGIVNGYGLERVLYAPAEGILESYVKIGDKVSRGQPIGRVGNIEFHAPLMGGSCAVWQERACGCKKGSKLATLTREWMCRCATRSRTKPLNWQRGGPDRA